MRTKAEFIIKEISDANYEELLNKLIYKLKRAPDCRLQPDGSLNNLWEEICAQKQTDNWDGWIFVDHYVESVCFLLCEELPNEIQYAMSYDLVVDRHDDEPCIYPNEMANALKNKLYQIAINYSNHRIDNYVYGN